MRSSPICATWPHIRIEQCCRCLEASAQPSSDRARNPHRHGQKLGAANDRIRIVPTLLACTIDRPATRQDTGSRSARSTSVLPSQRFSMRLSRIGARKPSHRGMVVSPDCHTVGETACDARFAVSKRVPSTIRQVGEPPRNPARCLAPVLRDLPRLAPREQRDLPDRRHRHGGVVVSRLVV